MGRILDVPYTTGELMSWIDPAGAPEYPLNGDAYLFLDGRMGFKGLPPMRTVDGQTPLQDGTVPRFTLAGPRPLHVPLLVKGSNANDFEAVRRTLQNSFNPKDGSGRLRCTTVDGQLREIVCRYMDGFEGNEASGVSSTIHMQAVVGFLAHDPYFYDVNATVFTATASSAPAFFNILPIHLGSSSVLGSFSIFNDGDAEAFPVFQITGPGSAIVLTNTTTGKVINTSLTLTGGQILTIDTQAKTVTRENGSNQYATLTYGSALWTLAVGQNAITLSMSGTTSASQIQILYKRRWTGA